MFQKWTYPSLLVFRNIFGATPSPAKPTSVLLARNNIPFPEDHADVITTALIILGKVLIPAVSKAITNGLALVPCCVLNRGSLDGTRRPTKSREIIYWKGFIWVLNWQWSEKPHTKRNILQNTRRIALGRFTRGFTTSLPTRVTIWMLPIANAALAVRKFSSSSNWKRYNTHSMCSKRPGSDL